MSSFPVVLHVSGRAHTHALDNLGMPLFVTDRDGVFLWVNARAKTLFGNVVGRRISSIVAPEQIGHARREFARKVTEQAALIDFDLVLLDSAGRRMPARIESVPLASDGSTSVAVFGAVLPRSAEQGSDSSSPDNRPTAQLTGRQRETLLLLGDGLGTPEIAARLGISADTARNHIRALLGALGAHSRLEAVAVAHRIGLLSPASSPSGAPARTSRPPSP